MKKTILFIDGENFLFGTSQVLMRSREPGANRTSQLVSINHLARTALKRFPMDEKRFYAAKIHVYEEHPELVEKSKSLQESQTQLKQFLERENVTFIPSGHVRLQSVTRDDAGAVVSGVFREKGTDVKIAVDMLRSAFDGDLGTALLLSSDSDMQPVIAELRRRGVTVVYVGFGGHPNIGLKNRSNHTVLLQKHQILEAARMAQTT